MLSNLSVFILIICDNIKSSADDYGLSRFFAKSMEAFGYIPEVDKLVLDGYLEVTEIRPYGKIKVYALTQKGKDYLIQNYDHDKMIAYVNSIEKSGFYANLLTIIKNK